MPNGMSVVIPLVILSCKDSTVVDSSVNQLIFAGFWNSLLVEVFLFYGLISFIWVSTQVWFSWKKRKDLGLKHFNPTEEGLASLHSVLLRKDPCLWRSALLYYTAYKAAFLSFKDLFQDLGKFVSDAQVRWDYCMRAKRGQRDTSVPGE